MTESVPRAPQSELSKSEKLQSSLTKQEVQKCREKEVTEYQEYCAHCDAGTLPYNHSMIIRMNRVAQQVAGKFGRPDRADSLVQRAWEPLAKGGYKGKGSLDGYIRMTMTHLYLAMVKKEKDNRRDEITEAMVAQASWEMPGNVARRFLSDLLIDELDEILPELPRTIMKIVAEQEAHIGHKRLAKLATERLKLKKPVTRHQVEQILLRIARLMLLPSDCPKPKAKSAHVSGGSQEKAG